LLKINSPITLEGHTDSHPTAPTITHQLETFLGYMCGSPGSCENRIKGRTGYGVQGFLPIQQLRVPEQPASPSNRQVSIIVQYHSRARQQEQGEARRESREPAGCGREVWRGLKRGKNGKAEPQAGCSRRIRRSQDSKRALKSTNRSVSFLKAIISAATDLKLHKP